MLGNKSRSQNFEHRWRQLTSNSKFQETKNDYCLYILFPRCLNAHMGAQYTFNIGKKSEDARTTLTRRHANPVTAANGYPCDFSTDHLKLFGWYSSGSDVTNLVLLSHEYCFTRLWLNIPSDVSFTEKWRHTQQLFVTKTECSRKFPETMFSPPRIAAAVAACGLFEVINIQ